jgi:hypothetical protein
MAPRFYAFQLLFLVPGLTLIIVSIYIPFDYFYKQIAWTRTEALFLEQIVPENLPETAYMVFEFTDQLGTVYRVHEGYDNTVIEGSDDQHFLLYYNPSNPNEFVMVNPGRYLVLLFGPFGLLLCYFGWPEKQIENVKSLNMKR